MGKGPKQIGDTKANVNTNETNNQTAEHQTREAAFGMREKQAMRSFKRDLFQFMHIRGFPPQQKLTGRTDEVPGKTK